MIRNYIKIAWRNLLNNKVYSFINIFGLATGLAVTILIGLWIWDEVSFDQYHSNHKDIAQVFIRGTVNDEVGIQSSVPIPLAEQLRTSFGKDFKHVVLSSGLGQHNLSFADKKFSKLGCFMEVGSPEMLSLKMVKGNYVGFNNPSSILLSESLAKSLFGDADPIGQIIKISNRINLNIIGVFEDFPTNSSFRFTTFIGSWELYESEWEWVKDSKTNWKNNAFNIYTQISPNTTIEQVDQSIKGVVSKNVETPENVKLEAFLHPMDRWHLYSKFEKGISVDGQIQYVRLVGIIGFFVLMLACINFMNLSTARSEKRAKEVGIRKTVGSARVQLIFQFFSESILTTFIAFLISLLLVQMTLPWFNSIAGKELSIFWLNPAFWFIGIAFSILTGIIAGSYPALYLSSFKPIKVLKGNLRIGKFASLPRSILVVLQFTISILLIIGTVVVFKQIQYAKDRPVGYSRDGLISIQMTTPEVYENYQTIQNELLRSGTVLSVSESQGPVTDIWNYQSGFEWKDKDPSLVESFATIAVTPTYGKTIGWDIKQGRDFSEDFSTDSMGLILNESAVDVMGLKDPIGESIKWNGKDYKVIGVVKNVIMNSPYEPVRSSVFHMLTERGNFINIRINPNKNIKEALVEIEAVFQKLNSFAPFDAIFADDAFALKFSNEERIGKLASFFSILAILISCLGLFGMASFIAEQKTKEIGIRKILGASIFNVWNLLSREFVILVTVAFSVAGPLAYLFMTKWLQGYEYHTNVTWWVFALTGIGALLIALTTVSFQAIKAAIANPVDSLRDE